MRLILFAIGILMSVCFATVGLAQNSPTAEIPDSNRFASQTFSSDLFKQIPQNSVACMVYQGVRSCSYKKRYLFKDIVLAIEERAAESITLTIAPITSASIDQALSYAKILTATQRITYDAPLSQTSDEIIYKGCRLGNSDYYSCTTTLTLNSNNQVIAITHTSTSE